jgi:hypothetical protein
MPRENEPDLEELPEETRQALVFVPVDNVGEVLENALKTEGGSTIGTVARAERQVASGGSSESGLHGAAESTTL